MFNRIFTSMPSDEKLLEIEGHNVVEQAAPQSTNGVGSGCVAVIGEFLKGTLINTPTDIRTSQELDDLFGSWGNWTNPGGAINASTGVLEPGLTPGLALDGNGYLAIARRKFAKLVVVGVLQQSGTCTITVTGTAAAVTIPAGVPVADADESDVFATLADVAVAASDFVEGVATKTLIPVRRVKGTAGSPSADHVLSAASTGACPGFTLDCTALSAMTDPNMVTSYTAALDSLLADEDPATGVNLVVLARHPATTQGEALMAALVAHCDDSKAKGNPRFAVMSPPLGTPKDVAEGSTDDTVGVGNVGGTTNAGYCYPGVKFLVPSIPASVVGTGSDGIVTWPFDASVAALMSQINPEQDPGETTDHLNYVVGVEKVPPTSGGTAAPLSMDDYIAFRAKGIMAPKKEGSRFVIQSGVTSAGPDAPVSDARMMAYIEASLAEKSAPYIKKLSTESRKDAYVSDLTAFLDDLKSVGNPDLQRIKDYSLDAVSGNTETREAKGIFIVKIRVKTLSALLAPTIVIQVGTTVEITHE